MLKIINKAVLRQEARCYVYVVVTLFTCKFDVHVCVQQQVLGLEVSVDDVVAVAVVDGCEDLPELLACLGFVHASIRCQEV